MGRPKLKVARTVFVPAELALVFTPDEGWSYLAAPPVWWWEQQEELLEEDSRPKLRLVQDAPLVDLRQRPVEEDQADDEVARQRQTPCRPGNGPCRRRHEHTSARRAG